MKYKICWVVESNICKSTRMFCDSVASCFSFRWPETFSNCTFCNKYMICFRKSCTDSLAVQAFAEEAKARYQQANFKVIDLVSSSFLFIGKILQFTCIKL